MLSRGNTYCQKSAYQTWCERKEYDEKQSKCGALTSRSLSVRRGKWEGASAVLDGCEIIDTVEE